MNHTERERMFVEIFQRHKAPIQRLCFAWLNAADEVEDLFQEIMSNVWNALPKFRGEARPLALFGGCVADFSAILFMVSDWRTQRAIARLHAQRNPFRTREFYIAMGGVWIGCNLILASHWPHETFSSLLPGFAFSTALPFAAYALGHRVRGKCFEKQCRPLIHRLEAVLETMEADRI